MPVLSPIVLSLFLLLVSLTKSGPTHDTDTRHGHDQTYFDEISNHRGKRHEHLYVHLIPHTHDDVGWLKTPDQYFSGAASSLQIANVELILDTVVEALLANPDRKFSYVEMKFFSMWWYEQTEQMKDQVKELVKTGRLEIINGGWSMSDEACSHYEDFLNNMMIGHNFIKEELGVAPRIGWHIDPFGHSNASPRLFAEMGFDAWFFGRLDYQDKQKRLKDREMEFVWRPFYESLGTRVQIFTHALYQHYSAPPGIDFDFTSHDDPFVDDTNLETYNADQKASDLYDWLIHQGDHYRTNHILVPMGDDFNYMNAEMYFSSMDKLIKFFNNKYSDVSLQYSTPSNYIDAIKSLNITWPTKYDDMFPYADDQNSYFTGYFTSRQNLKSEIRRGSHNLLASSKLYALTGLDKYTTQQTVNQMNDATYDIMDSMGVNQHHDAVTGTSKQPVADNYGNIVFQSRQHNNKVYTEIIQQAAKNIVGIDTGIQWQWCFKENSTYLDCPIANYDQNEYNAIVAIHNPSSVQVQIQKIQVPQGAYEVHGFNYNTSSFSKINSSITCDSFFLENTQNLINCNLFVEYEVEAQHIGFIALLYKPLEKIIEKEAEKINEIYQIESDYEILTFVKSCPENGDIFKLTKKLYNETYTFAFDFRWWHSYEGDGYKSSAYFFRPLDGQYDSLKYTVMNRIIATQTALVSELQLGYFNETTGTSADVVIRMYKSNPYMEWEIQVGNLPNTGMEVTINFYSFDINNEDVFYTDANGLEMQKRVLNYRPTWRWNGTQNVTSNYYPINTAIAIRDTQKQLQLTVMNSRPQGGTVVKTGRIELMQSRRIFNDDMGLDERDELGNAITVPAQYYVQLFNYSNEKSLQRYIQLLQDEPTQYFYQFQEANLTKTMLEQTFERKQDLFKNLGKLQNQKDLNNFLKLNLFLVKKNIIQFRLENVADLFDEVGANNLTQAPLQINVYELAEQIYSDVNGNLQGVSYVNIKETTITGNQAYTDMQAKKIQWKTVDDHKDINRRSSLESTESQYLVTLEKQRIRNFIVEYVVEEIQYQNIQMQN